MGTPVLMYHSLDDSGSAISVAPQVFQRQMRTLHEEAYQVISFGRLVNFLRNGQAPPDRSVAITFDDGFANLYASAAPVLAKYGFPATVFLVAGYCGKTNEWPSQPPGLPRLPLMPWSQIRELDGRGIEFGAHTFTHPRLDQLPAEQFEYELLESKEVIEEQLGHRVETFSYPYGRVSRSSAALVSQVYRGACTTRLGMVNRESSPLAVERIDAHYVQQPQLFKALSSPMLSLYLGLRRPVHSAATALLRRQWA